MKTSKKNCWKTKFAFKLEEHVINIKIMIIKEIIVDHLGPLAVVITDPIVAAEALGLQQKAAHRALHISMIIVDENEKKLLEEDTNDKNEKILEGDCHPTSASSGIQQK